LFSSPLFLFFYEVSRTLKAQKESVLVENHIFEDVYVYFLKQG